MEIKKENIEKLLSHYNIDGLKQLYKEKNEIYDKLFGNALNLNVDCDEFGKKHEAELMEIFEIDIAISIKKDVRDISFTWVDKENIYGILFPIDTFVFNCEHDILKDCDGRAFYVTRDLIADIEIYPSITKMGFFRKDFKYVLWMDYLKMPERIDI